MNNKTFRELRQWAGFTQMELAEKLGVSTATIAMIETNKVKVSSNVQSRLAKQIEITDDFLSYQRSRRKIEKLISNR